MNASLRSVALIFAFLGCGAAVAHADEVVAAKAGMRQRVAVIDQLKTAGEIGEANTGFLAQRGSSSEAAKVVAAENTDRSVVFGDTARKTGGSADSVGKAFARQIAAASKPGVWLQREDGAWYKK